MQSVEQEKMNDDFLDQSEQIRLLQKASEDDKDRNCKTNDIESLTSKSSSPTESTAIFQNTMKLVYGTGGIYAAFLYYGSLQEDVFNHVGSQTESKFQYVWFLSVLEALTNVILGGIGWIITSKNFNLPQKQFMITGVTQVSSKAFTSLSLANGLSFPVATLAKSAKMAPVMAGSILLGGAVYSIREYCQIGMIIAGTAVLSMGKGKSGKSQSTPIGLLFILLSLVMDGITGGVQKRLLKDINVSGTKPKPYDFMLFTNLYMMIVAIIISILTYDFISGMRYCTANPEIIPMILKFSLCSAIGQSFIFYTVAHFDPLVCSTVTTTRKIFSVLLSIFLKGHNLTGSSWIGVLMAISGIASEVESKIRKSLKKSENGV